MLLGMLLCVRSTPAGEKKDAPRTLAEDAKLLAEQNEGQWASEGTFSLTIDKKEEKVKLTIRFVRKDAKPSGTAEVGLFLQKKKEGTWAAEGGYKFELIESEGKRAIKLTPPGKGKPRLLRYSLVKDRLTINVPLGWVDAPTVPIQFKPGSGLK
jgi:hypothetical protein